MTSQQPAPEAVEAVAAVLRDGGADDLHGWRCGHPDRYGPCTCLAELAEDTIKAIRDALHREGDDAEAIRRALGLTLREEAGWAWRPVGDSGGLTELVRGIRVSGEWREAKP